MSGVSTVIISVEEADQRLDRWLRRRAPYLGQGRVERMCRKGEIRIDGGRVRASVRLQAGQSVRLPPIPKADPAAPCHRQPSIPGADAAAIQAAVLYRDAHMIVLNKPPGLATQGGSGQLRHIDGLARALCFDSGETPRLVHRLDKDTSGILLMARTRQAAGALTASFRDRQTRKIYWAAVAGAPHPPMGTIRYALLKAPGLGARGEAGKMRCVNPAQVDRVGGAKRATTDYAVLSVLGRRAAWMALVPITGRTHQLRAHMAAIGHPVVGDAKYGRPRQESLGSGISRKLHLHARHLGLTHPVTGAHLWFTAPLPEHMQHTWVLLGWRPGDVPADPFGDDRWPL